MPNFNLELYAEEVLEQVKYELTEGDKVLVGLWMVADALSSIRKAIGPTDVDEIRGTNLVEGMMRSADILGERIAAAASEVRVTID